MVALVAIIAAVVMLVSAPLRHQRSPEDGRRDSRIELEAEREAKYREIRDAELDFRTGKLSEEDYRALNDGLRSEAVAILRRMDAEDGTPGGQSAPDPIS